MSLYCHDWQECTLKRSHPMSMTDTEIPKKGMAECPVDSEALETNSWSSPSTLLHCQQLLADLPLGMAGQTLLYEPALAASPLICFSQHGHEQQAIELAGGKMGALPYNALFQEMTCRDKSTMMAAVNITGELPALPFSVVVYICALFPQVII